ncbi:hypothetical protein YC2023_094479 [Brassica napus]
MEVEKKLSSLELVSLPMQPLSKYFMESSENVHLHVTTTYCRGRLWANMRRRNWRMVQVMCISFSARLRIEAASTDYKHMSLVLQERLNALSASVNALSLLFILGMFGLIHYLKNRCVIQGKRLNEQKNNNPKRDQSCIDLDKLQNEFVFTTTEYMLSLKNSRWAYSGKLLRGQNI